MMNAPRPARTGFRKLRSNGISFSNTQTSTMLATFTEETATSEATAAPTTPHRGMKRAPPPMSKVVSAIAFASLTRVCPVMSIMPWHVPVPASTIWPHARMTKAVAPATNGLPNASRSDPGYRTMTRKNGMLSPNVHLVVAV